MATLEEWRKNWAIAVNEMLEKKGISERVDYRSNADRGIDELPTIHEGVAVRAMEKKGIKGKDETPFLLARIVELTKGDSLDTNIQLVLNNAKLGAQIAKAYCALKK